MTPARRAVDVVIPAGKEAAAVRACIARVLASRNATAFEVVILMDADSDDRLSSPDPRVTFVRARGESISTRIDRAIAAHPERDVVLLQPYADVATDWLDRLASHAAGSGASALATFTDAVGTAVYAVGAEGGVDALGAP